MSKDTILSGYPLRYYAVYMFDMALREHNACSEDTLNEESSVEDLVQVLDQRMHLLSSNDVLAYHWLMCADLKLLAFWSGCMVKLGKMHSDFESNYRSLKINPFDYILPGKMCHRQQKVLDYIGAGCWFL